VVGGQAGNRTDGRRVIADRQVLVTELARREAHLVDALAAVRPGRVTVEVAADLVERDERRRLAAEGMLAQLRWAERDPERRVDRVLVAAVRKGLERRHIRLRAGRAQELRAEALARRDDELDRHALDRD